MNDRSVKSESFIGDATIIVTSRANREKDLRRFGSCSKLCELMVAVQASSTAPSCLGVLSAAAFLDDCEQVHRFEESSIGHDGLL
jgi:hypothetical protein